MPHYTLAQRIKHRIPVRVRHYWKLLAVCAAFLVALTVVFGTERVRPYVTSASSDTRGDVIVNVAGTRDLFDETVAHTMSLTFDQAGYDRMLDSLFDSGEKEWIQADLTIDGTRVPSVGVRLKGNSTLMGLSRNGQIINRGGMPGGAMPGGGQQGGAMPAGGPRGSGFGGVALKAEEPEDLPWLISFDEYVEGRRYQGHEQIAVRVAGQGANSSVLNEAVALTLVGISGEPTQQHAYTSFTVNDRPVTARLIVEHPDDHFAEELGSSGVLYKSLASGRFTYQGEDPIEYADDFKQINKIGSQDVQPVIDLIKWATEAADEEFAAGLADHVDVESFARYVALQNLLLNFDDMAGPGHNYYLWYDLATKKFRVISWDYNLAFSGSADQGPNDSGGMGGMRPGDDGGFQPPDGFQPPEGFGMPDGFQPPQGGGGADGGFGGFAMGHVLKEKFVQSEAFTSVYEDAYRELYQMLYASGDALRTVDSLSTTLATVEGVDTASVRSSAEQLRSLIQQRTSGLSTNEVITGS